MDAVFGFRATKMKPQLKMAVQRINLIKNKKTNKIKVSKREIAQLLADEKEEKARIRAEALIREDFIIEAYEILELLCELCAERIALIATEKECPFDMYEAVCTLIWAANKTEVSELMEVKKQFTYKYGKEFLQKAMKNHDGCVNERILHKLSVQPPNAYLVLNYMSEIAKQFNVDWKPSDDPSIDSLDPMSAPSGFSVPQAPGSNFGQVYEKPPATMMATSETTLPPAAPSAQQLLEQQNAAQQQQLLQQQQQMAQMQAQMAQMAQMQQMQQMQNLPVVHMGQAAQVPLSGGGVAVVTPGVPVGGGGQLGRDVPVAGVPLVTPLPPGGPDTATAAMLAGLPGHPEVMTTTQQPGGEKPVFDEFTGEPLNEAARLLRAGHAPDVSAGGSGASLAATSVDVGAVAAGAAGQVQEGDDLERRLRQLQEQSSEASQGLQAKGSELHAKLDDLGSATGGAAAAEPPVPPAAVAALNESGKPDFDEFTGEPLNEAARRLHAERAAAGGASTDTAAAAAAPTIPSAAADGQGQVAASDPLQSLHDLPLPPGVSTADGGEGGGGSGAAAGDGGGSGAGVDFDDLAARFAKLNEQ